MSQEEFNKLLETSGLPKEFSQKVGQLIRTVNDYENRINSLEARVAVINNKINPEQQRG